jgi:hypothetical protein
MNEEQKAALDALYNTYSSQGYSVSKAFREMKKSNPAFNSGEARMYMQELYNTSPVPATQEPKKKSQDGSQSGSTSGTGSGVSTPTSGTAESPLGSTPPVGQPETPEWYQDNKFQLPTQEYGVTSSQWAKTALITPDNSPTNWQAWWDMYGDANAYKEYPEYPLDERGEKLHPDGIDYDALTLDNLPYQSAGAWSDTRSPRQSARSLVARDFYDHNHPWADKTEYKINPLSILLEKPDEDLDRILMSMQTRLFDIWVESYTNPVVAYADKDEPGIWDKTVEWYTGGVAEFDSKSMGTSLGAELIQEYISDKRTEGPLALNSNEVIRRLAIAEVLDNSAVALMDQGYSLEDALLRNEHFLHNELGISYSDLPSLKDIERGALELSGSGSSADDAYWKLFDLRGLRGGDARMSGMKFDRARRQIERQVRAKEEQLRNEYFDDTFANEFRNALPVLYNLDAQANRIEEERVGGPQRTGESRAYLAALEKPLKKRLGIGVDLSGDKKVGNRPLFDIGWNNKGEFTITGDIWDGLKIGSLNAWNGLIYIGTNVSYGYDLLTDDGSKRLYEGDYLTEPEIFYREREKLMSSNDEEVARMREQMNEYHQTISEAISDGDYGTAFEQSFIMMSEGAPYMAPLLFSGQLGLTGVALSGAFLGVASEASRIRNDVGFDTFTDANGNEMSYYEAAEKVGSYDVEEIKKAGYKVETDYWSRWGYLGAVGVGDFAINLTMAKSLTGAYRKGFTTEVNNWFKGYAMGMGVAVSENAMSQAFNIFARRIAEAAATGDPTIDFDSIAKEAIDAAIGTAPLSMATHTVGSVRRGIMGAARNPHVIPMDADEMLRYYDENAELQRRLGKKDGDAMFVSMANELILQNRTKIRDMQQTNVHYLEFLNSKHPNLFREVDYHLSNLERVRLGYRNTNDMMIKIRAKEGAAMSLQRLDEIYTNVKPEFDTWSNTVRGVREREDTRAAEGTTKEAEQQRVDERSSNEPTNQAVVDKMMNNPEPTPLSDGARRNPRHATVKAIGQRAKDVFNRWFRSSGGIKNKNVEEAVRSQKRLESAWLDEVTFDARLWRQLLKDVKRSMPVGTRRSKTQMKVTQDAMLDFMQGRTKADDPRLSGLTEDHIAQLTYFRSHLDGMTESLISVIEKQPTGSPEQVAARNQLIETLRNNKGVYLTRSYELFTDGGKRLNALINNDKSVLPAKEAAIRYLADSFDLDIDGANPMTKEQRYSKAEGMINQYLLDLQNGSAGGRGIMGAMDAPFLKARNNDLPEAYQRLLGVIDDPMFAYLNTSAKLNTYLSNARWQSELAMVLQDSGIGRIGTEHAGKSSPDGSPMVRLFPDAPEWSAMGEMYVPRQFKTTFENLMPIDPVKSWIGKTILKGQAKVKEFKTVYSPGTTTANFISGVMLSAANGHMPLSPTSLRQTFDAVSLAWGASAKRGLRGKGKYADEVWRAERKKLIEMGILKDGTNSQELMAFINDSMGGDVARILRGEGKVGFAQFAQTVYAFGDDFYKVNGYYQERQNFIDSGMSVADAEAKAAARVRGGYPTYSYISKGAKTVRQNPYVGSFVSFPYEMVRTTFNNFSYMIEDMKAGRTGMAQRRALGLALATTAGYTLSEYSQDLEGITDEMHEGLLALSPPWAKQAVLYYLGRDPETGEPETADLTKYLPHEVVAKPIRALMNGDPGDPGYADNVMGALNEVLAPYITEDVTFAFVADLYNNETSYGAPLYREKPGRYGLWGTIQNMADSGDMLAAYAVKQLSPGIVNNIIEFLRADGAEETWEAITGEDLPNGHPLEETQDFFQDYFPKETSWKEYSREGALLSLTGARRNVNRVNVQASGKISDWNNWRTKVMKEAWHDMMPQPELTMPEEVDERAAQYVSAYLEGSREIQKITNYMAPWGLNAGQILKALEEAGIGTDERGYYYSNTYKGPPFITSDQVNAWIKTKTWYGKPGSEKHLEWIRTAHQNLAQFNQAIARFYSAQMRDYNLSETEIQKLISDGREEIKGTETDWEDQD